MSDKKPYRFVSPDYMDRPRQDHPFDPVSMTEDDGPTDLATLLRRHVIQGEPLVGNGQEPLYGDFTGHDDYHAAMNRIREAEQEFDSLPAPLREAAGYDLGTFLDMVHDPEGRELLERAGLDDDQVPGDEHPSAPPKEEPATSIPSQTEIPGSAPPASDTQGD